MTACPLPKMALEIDKIDPVGMAALPNGQLIVSSGLTALLYVVNPCTGDAELIAGGPYAPDPFRFANGPVRHTCFGGIQSLAVIESERSLFVPD